MLYGNPLQLTHNSKRQKFGGFLVFKMPAGACPQ
jgi:hypothetical protein